MRFGLIPDRMVAYWEPGSRDLAMALVDMSGFRIAREGHAEAHRVPMGWELRIEYATENRAKERKMRREREKAQARS